MAKKYNEEFKKQVVHDYLKGTSYPQLSKEYGIAKSTIAGWVKKYSEECQYTKPHTTSIPSDSAREIHVLDKKIAELEKENVFVKTAATFSAKDID